MTKRPRLLTIVFTIAGLVFSMLSMPTTADSPEHESTFPLYPLEVLAQTPEESETGKSNVPTRITIPSVAIDFPVKPAIQKEDGWEFFADAVSYWKDSAKVGEAGNIILYAHRKQFFSPLIDAKIGSKIILTTEQRETSYTISQFRIVEPDQIEVFDHTSEEQLTLLTCTNEGDVDRLAIIAKPVSTFADLMN